MARGFAEAGFDIDASQMQDVDGAVDFGNGGIYALRGGIDARDSQ